MRIEFDHVKSGRNRKERGLSFEIATDFEIETAVIRIDVRQIKKELRFNAIGYIGNRLFHITCTLRSDVVRIISLRKANKREVKRYANT